MAQGSRLRRFCVLRYKPMMLAEEPVAGMASIVRHSRTGKYNERLLRFFGAFASLPARATSRHFPLLSGRKLTPEWLTPFLFGEFHHHHSGTRADRSLVLPPPENRGYTGVAPSMPATSEHFGTLRGTTKSLRNAPK